MEDDTVWEHGDDGINFEIKVSMGLTNHFRNMTLTIRRWEALSLPQIVRPQNCGGTELNCTVTCMVLKATANDRPTSSPLAMMNFVGLDLTQSRSETTTHMMTSLQK
ncbi:hypothetical protein TNCV_4489661 [Trichonephila clavipes]|nr:hypothetical protein TNCV_4489661 [Trichonephila clavipes]